MDWSWQGSSLPQLGCELQARRPAWVRIEGVPNQRVAQEVLALKGPQWCPAGPASCLPERLRQQPTDAEHPEAFWQLGEAHGYDVRVSCSHTGVERFMS